MIFADAISATISPTPEMVVIGGILVGAAALAHGANEIARFIDRFRSKPPMDEQVETLKEWIEDRFATKAELQHAKELFATTLVNQDTRITQIRTEVSGLVTLIQGNELRHEERAVQLHNRINPLLEAIGALREQNRRHSQFLSRPGGGP